MLTLSVVTLLVPAKLLITRLMLARPLVAAATKILQSLDMLARSQEAQVQQHLPAGTTRQNGFGQGQDQGLTGSTGHQHGVGGSGLTRESMGGQSSGHKFGEITDHRR